MTIISQSRRFVFVHVPKAAGTSLTSALAPLTTYRDLEIGGTAFGEAVQPAYKERFGLAKHSPFFRLAEVIGANEIRAFFCFAFVRNPFARAVSTYNFLSKWRNFDQATADRVASFGSFEEYALSSLWNDTPGPDNIFRPQVFWLRREVGAAEFGVDFIGRVENAEQDLATVLQRIAPETTPAPLKQLNRSGDVTLDHFANPKVVDRIRQVYAIDFARLGYSSDPEKVFEGGGREVGDSTVD